MTSYCAVAGGFSFSTSSDVVLGDVKRPSRISAILSALIVIALVVQPVLLVLMQSKLFPVVVNFGWGEQGSFTVSLGEKADLLQS